MKLDMNNDQKREKFQEAGYDDFCQSHQVPYCKECPECAGLKRLNDINAAWRSVAYRTGDAPLMYQLGYLAAKGLEDLSAPASPVEEKREEFIEWARSEAEAAYMQSTYEKPLGKTMWMLSAEKMALAAYRKLTESKPSPVIEIGEQRGWDSLKIIGRVQDRFNELMHKGWDWRSFYNGWLEGRSDMLITVNAEIGTLDEGQHPDEIYPRAITWLQERKNCIDEVERLRSHIAKLEGTTTEQSTICGCGRILIPRLDASGKKIGVTHETIEDEEHHSEYFRSLTVKPEASHPAPAPIVGEREEPNKCLCPDYPGEHAGCDFPECDRYAKKAIIPMEEPTEQAPIPEEVREWIIADAEAIYEEGENQQDYISGMETMYRKMQEEVAEQKGYTSAAYARINEFIAMATAAREEAATYRSAVVNLNKSIDGMWNHYGISKLVPDVHIKAISKEQEECAKILAKYPTP